MFRPTAMYASHHSVKLKISFHKLNICGFTKLSKVNSVRLLTSSGLKRNRYFMVSLVTSLHKPGYIIGYF